MTAAALVLLTLSALHPATTAAQAKPEPTRTQTKPGSVGSQARPDSAGTRVASDSAAVIVTSAKRAKERGLTPMARFVTFATAGVEPERFGIGPVPAIQKALKYVPAKHLFPCTNCGMAPMSREVAAAKLKALGDGAALARRRLKR